METPDMDSGKKDLASLYPEIAAQWDPEKNGDLSPEQVLPGSGKRIYWICEAGHSWQTAVYHRTEGHGCPICSAREAALKRGMNDLLTVSPELAAQWHGTKNGALGPADVTSHSGRKVWWQCGKGHEWAASVNGRQKGRGCPYCAGNRILLGYNDLVSINAPFLSEWDYEKTGSSGRKSSAVAAPGKSGGNAVKGTAGKPPFTAVLRGVAARIAPGISWNQV